jgi:ATP-dependent protease HslVU (ClpYQ) ATPase subunit
MKLLDKITGRDVEEFARQLAEMVAKRYPPVLDKAEQKRVSVNRVTKVLEDALEHAASYGREQKLGFYRKAKLANAFRWELKERGYSDKFIEVATEGMVVYITRAADKAAAAGGKGG